jgi:hypothetical protein
MNIYGNSELLYGDDPQKQRMLFLNHLKRAYTKFNPKIKSILSVRGDNNYGFRSIQYLNYTTFDDTRTRVKVKCFANNIFSSYNNINNNILFFIGSYKLGHNTVGVYIDDCYIPKVFIPDDLRLFKKIKMKLGYRK